jgi:hypothetical protein
MDYCFIHINFWLENETIQNAKNYQYEVSLEIHGAGAQLLCTDGE